MAWARLTLDAELTPVERLRPSSARRAAPKVAAFAEARRCGRRRLKPKRVCRRRRWFEHHRIDPPESAQHIATAGADTGSREDRGGGFGQHVGGRSPSMESRAQAQRAARPTGLERREGQGSRLLLVAAVAHQLLVPLDQPGGRQRSSSRSASASARLSVAAIASVVAVAPPIGLSTTFVDQPERLQARRGDAHGLGRVGGLSALFHRIEAQPSGEITE